MAKISIGDNIELIRALKEKIAKYRNEFSKNEALVRYALIDPFLRALGWDIEDPEQVKPEYSTEAGRPDYALFVRNKKSPRAFIGAKKLGKNEDLQQHISYCVSEGVKFFIATDGNHWELYDTYRETRLPEKKILEWDISDDNESMIAIRSISIANLESFGKTPVESIFTGSETKLFEDGSQIKARGTESIEVLDKKDGGQRKRPLHPISLTINAEVFSIDKSNQILIKTAEWLISKGKMTKSKAKIESGPDRWLVNTEPVHKNGKKFFNSHKLSNGLFLETHYSSVTIEKLAKSMMKYYGYPENSISVRWKK